MAVITNIEDLRVIAQRRVPRMFYDYADSGSWTESTYRANQADFQTMKLRQRVAVNGGDSAEYAREQLTGTLAADGYLVVAIELQNGAPDGLALLEGATLLDALSYEGAITAAREASMLSTTLVWYSVSARSNSSVARRPNASCIAAAPAWSQRSLKPQ